MDKHKGTAGALTKAAVEVMAQRGEQYDVDSGTNERSMARIVAAYNAIADADMSEAQGHLFMIVLKLVRAELSRGYDADHYIDGINYLAMYGEAKHTAEVATHFVRPITITNPLTGHGSAATLTPTVKTTAEYE